MPKLKWFGRVIDIIMTPLAGIAFFVAMLLAINAIGQETSRNQKKKP